MYDPNPLFDKLKQTFLKLKESKSKGSAKPSRLALRLIFVAELDRESFGLEKKNQS